MDPPRWSDSYYGKKRATEPLPEIIHTPFWVKSDYNSLIQLADLVAFVLRRFLEVSRHGGDYQGESTRRQEWIEMLEDALLAAAHRWPKRTASECAKAITAWAPPELANLGR